MHQSLRKLCPILYSLAKPPAINHSECGLTPICQSFTSIPRPSARSPFTVMTKRCSLLVRTVKDSGAAPCWAVVNHAGTRLYATNTGDNWIAVYDLTDPLDPVEIQHFVMDATTGAPFSTEKSDQSDEFIRCLERTVERKLHACGKRLPHP